METLENVASERVECFISDRIELHPLDFRIQGDIDVLFFLDHRQHYVGIMEKSFLNRGTCRLFH